LLIAVRGLWIIVSIVASHALLRNKFGMENVSAISGPVFGAENIVVGNPAMNNEERPGAEKIIFQRGNYPLTVGRDIW